ncbi:MAG TPA: TraR/DksA family transcriptional regulator [Dissulfurispiraceae bacterium]|nr:TraR/DksA family transcriptional regulator [Dissulfurispiraceae bacterium]
MFTEMNRREFSERLRQKKEEIILRSSIEMKKRISAENRQTLGAGLEEGDCAFSCHSDYIHFRNLDSQRAVIRQIDMALDKLCEGSFGVCEECGAEIGERRLKIVPFARFCRDCQETFEGVT